MLRVVEPDALGQEKRRSIRSRFLFRFTPAQQWRIRALLLNLRTAYGSWSCLAAVTGYSVGTLCNTASKPSRASLTLVARLAKSAGMSLEETISTGLVSVETCPTCGARKGAR